MGGGLVFLVGAERARFVDLMGGKEESSGCEMVDALRNHVMRPTLCFCTLPSRYPKPGPQPCICKTIPIFGPNFQHPSAIQPSPSSPTPSITQS